MLPSPQGLPRSLRRKYWQVRVRRQGGTRGSRRARVRHARRHRGRHCGRMHQPLRQRLIFPASVRCRLHSGRQRHHLHRGRADQRDMHFSSAAWRTSERLPARALLASRATPTPPEMTPGAEIPSAPPNRATRPVPSRTAWCLLAPPPSREASRAHPNALPPPPTPYQGRGHVSQVSSRTLPFAPANCRMQIMTAGSPPASRTTTWSITRESCAPQGRDWRATIHPGLTRSAPALRTSTSSRVTVQTGLGSTADCGRGQGHSDIQKRLCGSRRGKLLKQTATDRLARFYGFPDSNRSCGYRKTSS